MPKNIEYQGEEIKITKPFLKWIGGKTQIMNNIIKYIPSNIVNYHEIFLGGGSVLLTLLSLQKQNKINISGNIYAYDFNHALINTFNQIKKNHIEVITELAMIVNEFNKLSINTLGQKGAPEVNESTYKNTREHYYYWIRKKFNTSEKNSSLSAAYFIFLNKTGFRGMYREGNNGFNIPYGLKDRKSIPKILDESKLKNIANLIQNVEFIHSDFRVSIKRVEKGDYVYLDPPYVPFPDNKSFVDYNKDGFDKNKHEELFELVNELGRKNIKFALSNHRAELVLKKLNLFNFEDIIARRAINSKNPGATAKEVIVSN